MTGTSEWMAGVGWIRWPIFAASIALSFCSLWGWGWLFSRCARLPRAGGALTITTGLAAIIMLGGWLTLAGVAYALTLRGVLFLGLILGAIAWWRAGRRIPAMPRVGEFVASIPILLVAWFVARYLTPPVVFNIHDDLERYFAYPVKLLATGTLAPNPLGYLGVDTLGGQALLHGLVLAFLPLEYVGHVDFAFCFMLCLLLAGYGVKPGRWGILALLAQVVCIAIEPQIVNLSALFSGAVLVAAVTLASGSTEATNARSHEVLLGLFYAGLLALKSTFAVYVVIHFIVMIVAEGLVFRRSPLRRIGPVLWTVAFLLPWVVLHLDLYVAAVSHPLPGVAVAPSPSESVTLFSPQPTLYGSPMAHFTGLALLAFLLAAWAAIMMTWRQNLRSPPLVALCVAGVTAGVVYFGSVLGLGPLMFGKLTALRYAIAVFLGSFPIILRLPDLMPREAISRRSFFWVGASAVLMFALFLPGLVARTKHAVHYRSPMAYLHRLDQKKYLERFRYHQELFQGSTRERLAKIQNLVPAGESIVVWVMFPFLLDFSRNKVLHTDPYGLGMPWARLPADSRYLLLQTRGPGLRPRSVYEGMKQASGKSDQVAGHRVDAFFRELESDLPRAFTLYRDREFLLVRLPERQRVDQ